MRERSRRGRGIDYGKEVPFEVKPTAGFYDTQGGVVGGLALLLGWLAVRELVMCMPDVCVCTQLNCIGSACFTCD